MQISDEPSSYEKHAAAQEGKLPRSALRSSAARAASDHVAAVSATRRPRRAALAVACAGGNGGLILAHVVVQLCPRATGAFGLRVGARRGAQACFKRRAVGLLSGFKRRAEGAQRALSVRPFERCASQRAFDTDAAARFPRTHAR